MDPNEIQARLLTSVPPDIEPGSVCPERDLPDQSDFDSMNARHLATAVSEAFGIEIAETEYPEYPKLANVHAARGFVRQHLAAKP